MPKDHLTPLERALAEYYQVVRDVAGANPLLEFQDQMKSTFEAANPLRDYERQAAELRRAIQPQGHDALEALQRSIGEQYYEESTRLRDVVNATVRPWGFGDLSDQIRALTGEATTPLRLTSSKASEPTSKLRVDLESEAARKVREADQEVARLREDIAQQARQLIDHEANSAKKDEIIKDLESKYEKLQSAERLMHLRLRVESAAQELLYSSSDFEAQFQVKACDAYVMSIDIRRSTELMLKARDPELFAQFLVVLTQALREIVLKHHGIFDKFTGDGVLAFFPTFYSGADAGMWVLQAARQAHSAFATHYNNNRGCFSSVLLDVGLGIGIDFGDVRMVQFASEFTVVGRPVVYACRMAGAPAGKTLLNQPAYEQLQARYSSVCDLTPVEINLKHEGRTLAYEVRLNDRPFVVEPPPWLVNRPEQTASSSESGNDDSKTTAPPPDTPS